MNKQNTNLVKTELDRIGLSEKQMKTHFKKLELFDQLETEPTVKFWRSKQGIPCVQLLFSSEFKDIWLELYATRMTIKTQKRSGKWLERSFGRYGSKFEILNTIVWFKR